METGFGRFLRRTSPYETLQFFNIFIGQMAFIGLRHGAEHNEEELIKLRGRYNPSAFEVKSGFGVLAQNIHRMHDPQEKAMYDHE